MRHDAGVNDAETLFIGYVAQVEVVAEQLNTRPCGDLDSLRQDAAWWLSKIDKLRMLCDGIADVLKPEA